MVARATDVSDLVPSVSSRTWTLASRVPGARPCTAARYVVMPFNGAHDCTASDDRTIVTTSSELAVPASALSVRPQVAGRVTIAITLSPLPVSDPDVAVMPVAN